MDSEWCIRFGLTVEQLRRGGVHVAVDDDGRNDARSFRLDTTCIVVVPAAQLPAARDLARDLDPGEVFTRDYLERLLGPDAHIDGPSQHSYVTPRTFRGTSDPAVLPIRGTDNALLHLLDRCGPEAAGEAGFPREPAEADPLVTRFYGLAEGRRAGRGGEHDPVARPARRRRGAHPARRPRARAGHPGRGHHDRRRPRDHECGPQPRTHHEHPSLTVASRLGFERYGESYRARRQT